MQLTQGIEEMDMLGIFEQGIVGGVQNSVQSFMEMMCFCVGILISNPKVCFLKLFHLAIWFSSLSQFLIQGVNLVIIISANDLSLFHYY